MPDGQESEQHVAEAAPGASTGCARTNDLWVFGYGSLMWRPGFRYAEVTRAKLNGYHRAFCVSSTVHRGTPKRPGLVLGLDIGRTCEGVAYRVAAGDVTAVRRYLGARELINGVYRETLVPLSVPDHPLKQVHGIAYIVERAHPSYAGPQPLAVQAHVMRGARGRSGANLDYLINTVRQLREMGIRERELERLAAMAAGYIASEPCRGHDRSGSEAVRRVVARMPDRIKRLKPTERRRFTFRYTMSK